MKPEMKLLVDDFAKHTVAHDDAETAEEKNRYTSLSHAAFEKLVKKHGDDGREALTVLFDHDDPRIRLIAAVYLLRFKHDESMVILKELTKERGLVSLGAEQTMKNWETGDWELDPEPDAPE